MHDLFCDIRDFVLVYHQPFFLWSASKAPFLNISFWRDFSMDHIRSKMNESTLHSEISTKSYI